MACLQHCGKNKFVKFVNNTKICFTFTLSIKRKAIEMKTESNKIAIKVPTGTIKEWKKRLDNYGEKTACAQHSGVSRQTIQQVLKKGSGLRETIAGIESYVNS